MNDEPSAPKTSVDTTPLLNGFLPLLLLALSIAIVFIWQLTNVSEQRTAMQNTVARQDELVKQSRQVQSNLEKLVIDLLDLARSGDAEAQAIVTKYNIQQQGAPAATPAPAE